MNLNRTIKTGLVTAVIASSILSPIGCVSALTYCYFKHISKQEIKIDQKIKNISYKEKMPNLENLIVMGITEGYCLSMLKPDLVTKRYSKEGDKLDALSVSRINAKRPYAVMDNSGFLYLDNGVGGIPEDGYVDKKIFLLRDLNRGACDDYPHLKEI